MLEIPLICTLKTFLLFEYKMPPFLLNFIRVFHCHYCRNNKASIVVLSQQKFTRQYTQVQLQWIDHIHNIFIAQSIKMQCNIDIKCGRGPSFIHSSSSVHYTQRQNNTVRILNFLITNIKCCLQYYMDFHNFFNLKKMFD